MTECNPRWDVDDKGKSIVTTKHMWMRVPHHRDSKPGYWVEICRRCPDVLRYVEQPRSPSREPAPEWAPTPTPKAFRQPKPKPPNQPSAKK